jgi:hypothetical protein
MVAELDIVPTRLEEPHEASCRVAPFVNDVACTHKPVVMWYKFVPYELVQLHCCDVETLILEEFPHDVRITLLPLTSRHLSPAPRAPFKLMIGLAGSVDEPHEPPYHALAVPMYAPLQQ